MPKRPTPFAVRIPPALLAEVKALAAEKNMSTASLIKVALVNEIDKQRRTIEREERFL